MKLYLRPFLSECDPATGIGRVALAQYRYLPDLDVQFVDDPERADVIAVHTQDFGAPRVDVLHAHGFYWSGDPGSGKYVSWHHEANRRIVAAARKARAITVPSEWVAMPFKRDMRIAPHVIGHGIDLDEWAPGVNDGYVLWNKNRAADVCDPTPAWELASQNAPVVATFAPKGRPLPASMKITGRVGAGEMRSIIANAGVYLATTKETFGIGTLEALACGVPVLGYRWGATPDIVTHKQDGYLVEPGDLGGLMEGLEWIRFYRDELSGAAREKAGRYAWTQVIEQYAGLYRSLDSVEEPAGVAVVIPCYNYANYVCEAVDSALAQTHPVIEVIVVDDGSTDGSRELLHERYGSNLQVKVICQENRGVAAARNRGISETIQPFVVCLDADDRLDPHYVEVCRAAMLADRALGVAYTGLGFIGENGVSPCAWPPEFNWERQRAVGNPPSNCIHSAAMFRRSMWERAGGFRQAYAPGEDAEFWTRGLSVGFTARRVTHEALFHYRAHSGSASRTKKYKPVDAWLPWMRDRIYPLGAPSGAAPVVCSYERPAVSVIIPVGPGHAKYLPCALESLLGQTFRNWEAVIVNDSGGSLRDILRRYPFAQTFETDARSAGAARNTGLNAARAPLVIFLDADDYLLPDALEAMLGKYAKSGGRYVYSDWQTETGEMHVTPEYAPILLKKTLPHAVTALMSKDDALRVGGFDEQLPAWEDWDFFYKCAANGVCGVRLDRSLLVYRVLSGARRALAGEQKKELLSMIGSRYQLGGKKMCGNCGDSKTSKAIVEARQALDPDHRPAPQPAAAESSTRIEYIGSRTGSVVYFGKRKQYRFGNNATDRFHDVNPEDVDKFLRMEDFRLVPRQPVAAKVEEQPAPEFVPEPVEVVEPSAEAKAEAKSTRPKTSRTRRSKRK